GKDDVAGRLAAHVEAMGAHVLEHVAVADRRARERECQAPEIAFEAEIGHHGRHHAGLGEAAVRLPALRDHRQQLIAIDDAPALSRAMPLSARISSTFWQRAAGSVEPHSRLMLKPSGSTPSEITSAPNSHSACGATL